MHVAALALRDFRSYQALDLRWGPGVVVLLGANGQGKTNIVESLHYLATLSSHRVATDAPLVRAGSSRAHVGARLVEAERVVTVGLDIVPGSANTAVVNRSPVRAAREVVGLLRTVLFAPEDLALVKGDPSQRRRFLDQLLLQRRPRFAAVRADYDRVLKQRTALLRSAASVRRAQRRGESGPGDLHALEVWDSHLARTGAELVAGRVGLLGELEPVMAAVYADLAPGSGPATARYRSSVAAHGVAAAQAEGVGDDVAGWHRLLDQALAHARADELDRGQCLVGPHRDDLLLGLGDLPARGYASQGEAATFALALRLASFDLLATDALSPPVLMLDDVFAELDSTRRDHVVGRVEQADQVIVTAAVAADVPSALSGQRFVVSDGQVCLDDG